MEKEINDLSFWEFYELYLTKHRHPVNKVLHLVGNILTVLYVFLVSWLCLNVSWIAAGYFLYTFEVVYWTAHYGHKHYEKNTPLGIAYKLKSKVSDWIMCFQLLTFQLKWDTRETEAKVATK